MHYERNICATLHRKSGDSFTRRYVRLDTAIPTMTRYLLLEGAPGDVVEFHHSVTSLQIGTAKMRVNGRIETQWVWDEQSA